MYNIVFVNILRSGIDEVLDVHIKFSVTGHYVNYTKALCSCLILVYLNNIYMSVFMLPANFNA